jgi:glycosyltransferase involved in cell wall biosynthesis
VRPLRLCLVCNEYPPGPHGGIGVLTRTLARGLARASHDVRVIGIYARDYPAPDYEVDEDVRVWRLREPAHRFGWVRSRLRLLRRIRRWIREGSVDVVEVPDWQGMAAGWPRLGAPVVARLSGSATYFLQELRRPVPFATGLIERASLWRANFWCGESVYIAERTREVFSFARDADIVLYNPVEMPAVAQRPRAASRAVFAGTLTEKKGIVSLIRAWSRVVEARPDATLDVFGRDESTASGSMRDRLRAALTPRARETVRFHDPVSLSLLLDAFAAARVAVLPSYAEGFALTPLHAMSCGCPTIYGSCGSGPELVHDGVDGLLVDPDDVDGLAASILRVMNDDGLARALGEAGRARIAADFALDTLLPRNAAFYDMCREQFAARAHRRATSARPMANAAHHR